MKYGTPASCIARAADLATRYPAAAELLRFYHRLLRAQRDASTYEKLVEAVGAFAPKELRERTDFLERVFRQVRASATLPQPGRQGLSALCPCCGDKPQVAVLREEQHGALRNLACATCAWEWSFQRILCPACGEDRFDSLPVFHAEEYPAMRVEACDTCHVYLLCVDMTKDGRAVPIVDDVAALSLHLWAGAQGYHRLHPGLFF